MVTHSSTPACKIPWTEEPGRLQSMRFVQSRTQLSSFTFTFHFHALEKEMATHSSVLAWRIHGQRSLMGYIGSPKESDTTEGLNNNQSGNSSSGSPLVLPENSLF